MANTENLKHSQLLYVVIALLVLNLAGTTWLIVGRGAVEDQQSGSEVALPKLLKEQKENIFDSFQGHWNNTDAASIYDMFDRLVQLDLPREQTIKQIEGFILGFGPIEDAVYSHYLFEGKQAGRDHFVLFYKARFGGDNPGTRVLKISVYHQDQQFGIWGFNVGG